jgi:prophage tail gpP-like protein
VDNTFVVVASGSVFDKFKSASLSISLDALASSFSFVVARETANSGFSINDDIQILINGQKMLTGKINRIEASYSIDNHDYIISGFSNTYDLLKGTIFANPNYQTPLAIKDLALRVFSDNEISSVGINGGFAGSTFISSIIDDEEAGTSGDIGETIFSFLDRYSRKIGVILSTDIDGNLVIYKNAPVGSGIILKNKKGESINNTIKSANYVIDYSQRLKKVKVMSQDEDEELIEAEATDSSVKTDGVKTIISENLSDVASCTIQAKWEVNKRISDSVSYQCSVYGFENQGTIYDVNLLAVIDDDFAGVSSSMLIREVQFTFSEFDGSNTNLTFVLPNAYSEQTSSSNPSNNSAGQ